jgi:hypothetical protein
MWMHSDVKCAGARSVPTTGKFGSACPNQFSTARHRNVFAAPGSATKARKHTPYCVSSSDHMLSRVLGQEWPHEDVLEALP